MAYAVAAKELRPLGEQVETSEWEWHGRETLKEFWEWARQQGPAVFLVHNSKAYDTVVLLKTVQYDYFKAGDKPPPPVTRGNSIMQLRIGNIVFMDSKEHLKGPLSKLPATYNMRGEAKGFCPYEFYDSFEALYSGPQKIPDVSLFSAKTRCEGGFQEWHDSFADKAWDPFEEAMVYLRQDVRILAEACARHRELFIE